MAKVNWNETLNRLSALREEIDGETEEETTTTEDQLEGLSMAQLTVIAEMLEISVEDLLKADENTIKEAMEYVGYQVIASSAKYGRPGLTGKFPWDKNNESVGVATPHAAPASSGLPGTGSATVPSKSSSPVAQKGKASPSK